MCSYYALVTEKKCGEYERICEGLEEMLSRMPNFMRKVDGLMHNIHAIRRLMKRMTTDLLHTVTDVLGLVSMN